MINFLLVLSSDISITYFSIVRLDGEIRVSTFDHQLSLIHYIIKGHYKTIVWYKFYVFAIKYISIIYFTYNISIIYL